jgi:acid stress-induced BolA-like protein IbaG/YrbA
VGVRINRPPDETAGRIREAIESAIEGSRVEAQGLGGHFEIRVVSPVFAGKSTLQRQRLVLGAIAHLMKGDSAPVHAVDRIEAVAEDEG